MTQEQEQKFEKEYQYFERKRQRLGFETTWCISEIRLMHLKTPFKGKYLTNGINEDIKVPLPSHQLTGGDLWKYSDMLYKMLGDVNHRFIESFQLKGDTIEVFFGS